MNIKEKVQSMVDFDISYIVKRFIKEKKLENEEDVCDILYSVVGKVLNHIHQRKIPSDLETTLYDMMTDYYDFNGLDKRYNSKSNSIADAKDNVKSIQRGNEKIEFKDNTNVTKINGTNYSTSTISPDDDLLISKYSRALNRHRKMRW